MRTIRIIEHISLDGVIQGPGGPEEDPSNGFNHGGWGFPEHDDEVGGAIVGAQGQGFDLLLGRKTYDIFAGYWPKQAGPMADNLNGARKFVATHRPESLAWGPVQGLGSRDSPVPWGLRLAGCCRCTGRRGRPNPVGWPVAASRSPAHPPK